MVPLSGGTQSGQEVERDCQGLGAGQGELVLLGHRVSAGEMATQQYERS